MKKSLEEKIRSAVENDKLNFEKFIGSGYKWYHYYLVVVELVWARNFCDGYDIYVYNNEFLDEHLATFKVDFVIKYNNGFNYVPRIQTHYLKEEDVA